MRTYTQTVREGERTGDVDWGYDFRQHFNSDARRDEICAKSVQRFRDIADLHAAGTPVRATTYGGWPRCGFGDVLDVGMYDGWPYWRPVPSVLMRGVIGGAGWHSFCSLTDYETA